MLCRAPLQCPPEYKLPILYVLDSIVKNVGGRYTPMFEQRLCDMVPAAFAQVLLPNLRHPLFFSWGCVRVLSASALRCHHNRLHCGGVCSDTVVLDVVVTVAVRALVSR